MQNHYILFSLKETYEISKIISTLLKKRKRVAFYGDLGSGKSVICRNIIRLLTSREDLVVPSPTFNIVNTYNTPIGIINHCDLYRLKNVDEINEIGLMDMLNNNQMCLIEWPEIIQDYIIFYKFVQVELKYYTESKRTISWSY